MTGTLRGVSNKHCLFFFFSFDRIFFILAGKEDNHKILEEFEFWRDPTTDSGITCP